MTYSSIVAATRDQDLVDRVTAAVIKEAWANEVLSETKFGKDARAVASVGWIMVWPVAIDYEAQYEFALGNEVERPGLDPGVISDANIQAAVQVHWPTDAA